MQGKLVEQDPNDESVEVLLEKIRAEKQKLFEEGKIKKKDLDISIVSQKLLHAVKLLFGELKYLGYLYQICLYLVM
ncbi:type I restriction-modification system subunit S [Streptococcus pneumoniae]|nr:type I restriction-modification system subunit S [Streptococcus pneumoniae]